MCALIVMLWVKIAGKVDKSGPSVVLSHDKLLFFSSGLVKVNEINS